MHPNYKALLLFDSVLSPSQRTEFMNHQKITCVGNLTGKRYTLQCSSGNIHNIKCNGFTYCINIQDEKLPVFDTFVAQKLTIENDESHFLQVANRVHRVIAIAAIFLLGLSATAAFGLISVLLRKL